MYKNFFFFVFILKNKFLAKKKVTIHNLSFSLLSDYYLYKISLGPYYESHYIGQDKIQFELRNLSLMWL